MHQGAVSEHRIQCEFGHVRRPEEGADTTFCPRCMERRIKARVALGEGFVDLLDQWAKEVRCATKRSTRTG
jgi:hypothetical protein